MASEVVEGKRTFIERSGRVFELPERDELKLTDDEGGGGLVSLTALVQGSVFELRGLEEHEDRVIVHLGPEMGQHVAGDVLGYPFPS